MEDPWEFPRTQLFFLENIGKGAFGEVRKAIAKGLLNDNEEVIVAVKQAKKGGKYKCNGVLDSKCRMTYLHRPID